VNYDAFNQVNDNVLYNNNNNNEGLLNTCCGTRCKLTHVCNVKTGNRKHKNTNLRGLGLQKCLKTILKIRFTRNYKETVYYIFKNLPY